MDEANAVLAAAVDLEAGAGASPAPQLFALPARSLPVRQLQAEAVAALRGVLPAWQAALSADQALLEEQLPTKQALQVGHSANDNGQSTVF